MPVKTFDIVQDELIRLHDTDRLSWAEIKLREPYSSFARGSISSMYHGWEPKTARLRARLGLSMPASVVVILGSVPDGSQALAAYQCTCGQFFIPNHPRRKRCFICSPFKGGKHEDHP